MRNLAENFPPSRPELYTSEGQKFKRKLELVGDLDKEKSAEEELVNNEELLSAYLNGFLMKHRRKLGVAGSFAVPLAMVGNRFIAKCLEFTDEQIDTLVKKFNTRFGAYLNEKTGYSNDLTDKQLDSVGIKSAIKYIRSREKVFENSTNKLHYFFENNLDARYKIDLIEVETSANEHGELIIETINLIQVKSGELSPKEREDIFNDHKEWNDSVNSFELRQKNIFLEKLTEEVLKKNSAEAKDLLLDICSDPEKREFKPDAFIATLDLGEINDRHKVYILLRYAKLLRRMVPGIQKEYNLNEEYTNAVLDAIKKLEDRIRKLEKELEPLKDPDVNSVTVVIGEKTGKIERSDPRNLSGNNKRKTERNILRFKK